MNIFNSPISLIFKRRIRLILNRVNKYRSKYEDFEVLRQVFYNELWTTSAAAINAKCEDLGDNFFRITKNNKETFVRLSNMMLDNYLLMQLIGNKTLTNQLFEENGYRNIIPQYQRYSLKEMHIASEFMKKLKKPVVVKPAIDGCAGIEVTANINTWDDLRRATISSTTHSSELQIEEQIAGDSYRLLFFQGQFVDAVKRGRPTLTGDGNHTISQLVNLENKIRLTKAPITSLFPLTEDLDFYLALKKQQLTPKTILEKGRTVEVKEVCNQNATRDNLVVHQSAIHNSILSICTKIIGKLNVQLAGVDLITPDISQPLEQVGGAINEINTVPGLHYHYMVANRNNDAKLPLAEMLLTSLLQ